MNIFYLDSDPCIAPTYLMDIHVRKMIVESCQLLMTHDILNGKSRPYKPTHINHPCRKALDDRNNYLWLCTYFGKLCFEYMYRFSHEHLCTQYYFSFYNNFDKFGRTTFPQCMPDEFKNEDIIKAYRDYYRFKFINFTQRGLSKYTKRNIPQWLK